MHHTSLSPSSMAMAMTLTMSFAAPFIATNASVLGPDWDEIVDAGATPATAQRAFGTGPLESITGTLALAAIAGEDEDLQDMYLVRFEQPTVITFSASTDAVMGGSADFDTQLWLFDADGFGLLANDDTERKVSQSTLLDASTDGSGVVITEPGLYFIAVSGEGTEPLSDDDDDSELFLLASPTEISGPDGPGGIAPIVEWSSDGDQGTYTIAFTGVAFITPGDLNGDGVVDVDDLVALILAWGDCPDCIADPCIADLNADCVVDVDDLVTVILNWG